MTEKWDVFQRLGIQTISSSTAQEEDDVIKRMQRKLEASNRRRELCHNSIGVFMQEAVAFDMDKTISPNSCMRFIKHGANKKVRSRKPCAPSAIG